MTPMGLNSTPFLSYRDIKTDRIDLFEDAFGFCERYSDVIGMLKMVKPVPGKRLTNRVKKAIRRAVS
jgi:hypothetical protein